MSKHLQPSFTSQWLLIQVAGALALAIATQAIVTLVILLLHVDNLFVISMFRLAACMLSRLMQGYLQWQILKQFVKTLDRRWMYTSIVGLPFELLTWLLIHLAISLFVLDEDGTVLIILAIVGALGGALHGRIIGNWQKSLFKQSLYWRSLWHDWDRDRVLAGALSGIVAAVIIICAVFLGGWSWLNLPLMGLLFSIGLAAISPLMDGFIFGDTIHDVFVSAKLIK
jgi:hypothetical protein